MNKIVKIIDYLKKPRSHYSKEKKLNEYIQKLLKIQREVYKGIYKKLKNSEIPPSLEKNIEIIDCVK